ncbi:DNA-directed RNA polymerases IV and V subunit 4-like isoform X2 [Magnolia sinica]|uniref:DNA-directed RNA polymerases IV and V subunit 4-like isoform X2 n=1 Tax=Magnolia sinica TaxID=86752 RepID=UPI00265A7DC7|nr:DNA-directed RNA polymerases IV and V subunit 4-like isoform X2 [Magnolia sinica]
MILQLPAMAEKGGKRFSALAGKKVTVSKSTAKKNVPLKGKDDSSSKKGRKKVHFELSDSEDSEDIDVNMPVKSAEKGKGSSGTPIAKGDWAKGGKDDRMGKAGGKSSGAREPVVKVSIAEVELKIEEELPKNAKCLMDCEAALVLQGIEESLSILSADPAVKIPESFFKGLQYAKTGSHYTSPEAARQVLSTLKRNKVTDGEICMIGNICPETVDEVFALVPSLKANRQKNEGPIKDALYNLAKHKQSK